MLCFLPRLFLWGVHLQHSCSVSDGLFASSNEGRDEAPCGYLAAIPRLHFCLIFFQKFRHPDLRSLEYVQSTFHTLHMQFYEEMLELSSVAYAWPANDPRPFPSSKGVQLL